MSLLVKPTHRVELVVVAYVSPLDGLTDGQRQSFPLEKAIDISKGDTINLAMHFELEGNKLVTAEQK